MPNIAVGQRVLITAVGEYFGQRTMNTFLYRVSAVTGTVTDVAMADALHTTFTGGSGLLTKLRACSPAEVWVGLQAWYQVLGPLRFRKIVRDWDTVGSFDTASNTANVQGCITRLGEFGTRRNVGGIRVPIPSQEGEEGKLSDELKAVLQTLATEMEETISSGAGGVTLIPQVGVPGYQGDPPELIPVTDSLDLGECVVQDTVRVIRRRTLRVGI